MSDLRIFAGLVMALFPFQSLASETSCAQPLRRVEYAAEFQMKHGANAAPTSLRLLIGLPKLKKSAKRVAQIWSGRECRALCEAKRFTRDSVDLQCKNAQMATFSTRASVILPETALRFGTWLQGYEQIPLKVSVDRLSSKPTGRNSGRTLISRR
jgi:hypothetical protein